MRSQTRIRGSSAGWWIVAAATLAVMAAVTGLILWPSFGGSEPNPTAVGNAAAPDGAYLPDSSRAATLARRRR